MKSLPAIIAALGILCLATGCGTMEVTKMPQRTAATCAYRAEQKGFAVGVHPLLGKEEVKEVFKINLRDKGILPILVVAENQHPSSSFILLKTNAYVIDAATRAAHGSQRTNVTATSENAAVAMGFLGAAALSPALLITAIKIGSDAVIIQHNMEEKEFFSRTLGPGQTASGFIYFRQPQKLGSGGDYDLVLEVQNSATREVTPFDIKLNLINPKP